jgi:excisionase family DNA binding protein
MDTTQKVLLSKKEAAQALSISLRSLEYLIARKVLPIRRIGKRVLVPVAALYQFARRDHADPIGCVVAKEL